MTMFIVRISEIGFIVSDNHTVGYHRRIVRWIGGQSFTTSRPISPITAVHAIGRTFEDALEKVRVHFVKFIRDIPDLNVDPADLYFREMHCVFDEKLGEGLFLPPDETYYLKYRLSDGKII